MWEELPTEAWRRTMLPRLSLPLTTEPGLSDVGWIKADTKDGTRLVEGQEFQYSKAHTHQPTGNQKISNLGTILYFRVCF